MTLKKLYIAGGTISVVVLVTLALFLGSQGTARALEVQGPGLPTECSDLIDNDNDGVVDFVIIPFAGVGDPDCENIFDNSESGTSGSGNEGGNGNPPLNQCMDGIDNDNDGDIDLADHGCTNVGDNDESTDGNEGGGGNPTPTDVCPNIDGTQTEVPSGKVLDGANCVDAPNNGGGTGGTDPSPTSGGGSGGDPYPSGGSGGSRGTVLGTTTAETTSATTSVSCDTYLTTFIKMGQKNDSDQVKRLQSVLKNYENADVEENGEYDDKTLAAVKVFQGKYGSEILTPWGIKEPTGYVFLTTRKKVNEVYCKNTKDFPLTKEEEEHIAQLRSATEVHVPKAPVTTKPSVKPEDTKIPETKSATATDSDKGAVDLPGNSISNFFRRLFDRFR